MRSANQAHRKKDYIKSEFYTLLSLFIIGLLILVVSFYKMMHHPAVKGASTAYSASEVISLVNATREQHGLNPLHPQAQLMQAAEAKAQAMLAANAWSHNTPTQTPWSFIDSESYIYTIAGENLAKDFSSAAEVVKGWMNSPSHRDNLLNPEYTETGVAVVEGAFQSKPDTYLVVEYLAKPYQEGDIVSETPHWFESPMLIHQMGFLGKINPMLFLIGFLLVLLVFTSGVLLTLTKRQKILRLPNAFHWHT